MTNHPDQFDKTIQEALRKTQQDILHAAIEMLIDIHELGGDTTDCIAVLKEFKLRLAARSTEPEPAAPGNTQEYPS